MKNIGVICEYNPFHNGHAKQLEAMKRVGTALCLMSGNYVQRGEPAIADKYKRAEAAVRCGADLVLELPLTYALRSAEGFARGGVEIFSELGCVDSLCFGSESGDAETLMKTADLLLTEEFSLKLRHVLSEGVSFPRARQKAVEALGGTGALLEQPNDILAVEYCKAILSLGSSLKPMVLRREGSYHDSLDRENPAATTLRKAEDWNGFVPGPALEVFFSTTRHTVQAGERAWLARLRSMSEKEFEALPYGSEGLWRKVFHACRRENSLEEIIAAAKSKRYTRTRLMRMLLCAYLGLTEEELQKKAPYVRILAMNQRGQAFLHDIKDKTSLILVHPGEKAPEASYGELERRASDLYGLFAVEKICPPAKENARRIFIL